MDNKVKFDIEIRNASEDDIAEDRPLSFGEWLRLDLTKDKKQRIIEKIIEKRVMIEEDRKAEGWDDMVGVYRNQYSGEIEESSSPFPGAYCLNVPITTKYVDGCVSQTEEAFEDIDPKWTIERPTNKKFERSREIQEKVLDYYSDMEMEDVDIWSRIYHDAYLLPCGWGGMVYKREVERIRDNLIYNSLDDFIKDFPDDYQRYPKYIEELMKGEEVNIIVEYNQETVRSSKPEHYEWEDIYVPLGTKGVDGMRKAPIIVRRVGMMTWGEIALLEKEGDYDEGVSDELMYEVDENGEKTNEIDPDYMDKEYEVFEAIYFVDIDGDGRKERCLFNYEETHKLGLRSIRYPYNHNRPYIVPFYTQTTRKGIYQLGLGEKLHDTNIAASATLNHVLNASTIANSLSLKVRSGTDAVAALYEKRWFPGCILELMNLGDVEQFIFNTPNLSGLINLFGIIQGFGDDISGIVPYQLGQESAEDPDAPASKAITLMRKAEVKLRRYIKCLKRSNNEMGYQALRLIYQYTPKERIADILGIDFKEVREHFSLPLRCKTQASGFALEKMFAKRDNMQMLNILMQEPFIRNDATKRIMLYETVAAEWGSSWDKKLAKIISVDEVKEMQARAEDNMKKEKFKIMLKAAREAKAKGRAPEEMREIVERAGSIYDQMLKQGGQGGTQSEQTKPNTVKQGPI